MKLRCAELAVVVMMTWPLAASIDPFYEQRLQSGKNALAGRRFAEAADQLRIAAFGLLSEPKRLTEALALLALAQNALGQTGSVEATVNRFADVESRFPGWDSSVLNSAERKEFESLLLRLHPKAKVGAAKSDPLDVASRLIAERRTADAVKVLSEAIARDPNRRPLRLLLLQAATTTSRWSVAAAQVTALKPFADTESVSMFYAAVALFETGRLTEARQLLDRSLPRLTRSPYIDQYVKKIKG